MSYLKLSAIALAVFVSAHYGQVAQAQDFHEEEFSSDADGLLFEPDTRDPASEPDFDGVPPVDWVDVRNGSVGVIEENLVLGDPSYPAPDPGADTPEYGVVQHESGDGPSWSPATFDNDCLTLCYNIDIYADPFLPTGPEADNIPAQVPDFWWTNAVADAGGSYITEAGITGWARDNGTWTFMTTGPNNVIAVVPVGSWYELEVCFVQGADGTLDTIRTVYDATGTIPLGSFTETTAFLNPVNQPMSADYTWFTFFRPNVDVLFVDDFRVECVVPEPCTFALLGMGVGGLVVMARRRRRL